MIVKPFAIGTEVVIDSETKTLRQVVLFIQVKDEKDRRIGLTHAYSRPMIDALLINENYRQQQSGFLWMSFLKGLAAFEKKEKNYVSDSNIEALANEIVKEIPEAISHVTTMENYCKRFGKEADV